MRQIVSLIKDNQAHFALVDTDDGSMIPFADLLIPDPERFGLQESAIIGTELINVLGLNGTKRPKMQTITLATMAPAFTTTPEPEALPAARQPQQPPHRPPAPKARPKDTSKSGVEWYIMPESIITIVNQYPEGIRVNEVADRLWRQAGREGPAKGWVYSSVMNRLLQMRMKAKEGIEPMPFREEKRPTLRNDGTPGKIMGMYLVPHQRDQLPV